MRVQTEEIRRKIVNAAYESFWRLGYRRASVDNIAARAGVTKRTVYAYFRSKDDLLAAVLQHYEELAAERLAHIGERMPPDRSGHDPEKCEAVFRRDHAQTRI
jgi:AcrR family transcriptional regulator